MSRPGPRPYECARRAWHSDRHQPMRGSIIQQIFRVVTESHCPATKKNIEWQEKLPIVVLKAEEIMYSKANSEAEYMDLGTLWDRVNDAIDTIIKRDESTETGDLLPPCVEVRASRSQRLANPRTYLPPRTQAHGFVSPKVLHNTTNEQNPQLPHLHNSNQVTSARPVAVNSTHVPESNRHVRETNSSNIPAISCNIPSSSHNQVVPVESNTSQNESSVCPLDYGIHFQSAIPQLGFEVSRNPNPILLGKPIFPSSINTAQMGSLQNLFSCERDESASTRVSREDSRDNHGKSPEKGFDLSLRLGWFEDTCTKPEKVLDHDANAVDLSSYQMGSMFNDLSPHPHKEFSFFPVETASDPLGFRKRESEVRNEEAAVRKRKAPINDNLEDGLFFLQSELRPNHFFGRMKRPGS